MRHKRIAAAEARTAAKKRAEAARAQEVLAEQAQEKDVVPWLRQLGFGTREARCAAELCQDIPDASLEERVRVALSYFHVKGTRVVPAEHPSGLRATERGFSAAC
jgi:Holliday junction resolvasome RuvABC DNA-binding subunit